MHSRLTRLAQLMADSLYVKHNKALRDSSGLSSEDRDMFDRIFRSIENERREPPEPITNEHFSCRPGWKPNQTHVVRKVLSNETKKDIDRRRHAKRVLSSLSKSHKIPRLHTRRSENTDTNARQ